MKKEMSTRPTSKCYTVYHNNGLVLAKFATLCETAEFIDTVCSRDNVYVELTEKFSVAD